jgi:hypothetical protein
MHVPFKPPSPSATKFPPLTWPFTGRANCTFVAVVWGNSAQGLSILQNSFQTSHLNYIAHFRSVSYELGNIFSRSRGHIIYYFALCPLHSWLVVEERFIRQKKRGKKGCRGKSNYVTAMCDPRSEA